jgi:hypothetical protein
LLYETRYAKVEESSCRKVHLSDNFQNIKIGVNSATRAHLN